MWEQAGELTRTVTGKQDDIIGSESNIVKIVSAQDWPLHGIFQKCSVSVTFIKISQFNSTSLNAKSQFAKSHIFS